MMNLCRTVFFGLETIGSLFFHLPIHYNVYVFRACKHFLFSMESKLSYNISRCFAKSLASGKARTQT